MIRCSFSSAAREAEQVKSMPIIEVDHVTKAYRLGVLHGIRQTVGNLRARLSGLQIAARPSFKALDDVSFSIEEGEVVGLIGHNGAGKSTLLKLLARITAPTAGRINVRGRVAPLIEVGAGLVPDLTGRENVYLNGAILGMRREEIEKKFDEIVAFAELDQFIDTPVKRYSSGMQVRLGFSIATSVDADILIVDEVLAVGDLAFQRKCFDRMEDFVRKDGKSMFLVSHNIRQVERLCDRVILMDHGKALMDGDPRSVCNRFYEMQNAKVAEDRLEANARMPGATISSSDELSVNSIEVFAEREGVHGSPGRIRTGDPLNIVLHLAAPEDLDAADIGIGLHTTDLVYLGTVTNSLPVNIPAGRSVLKCRIRDLPLSPGVYAVRAGFKDKYGRLIWYGEHLRTFEISGRDDESLARVVGQSLVCFHGQLTISQSDDCSRDRLERHAN